MNFHYLFANMCVLLQVPWRYLRLIACKRLDRLAVPNRPDGSPRQHLWIFRQWSRVTQRDGQNEEQCQSSDQKHGRILHYEVDRHHMFQHSKRHRRVRGKLHQQEQCKYMITRKTVQKLQETLVGLKREAELTTTEG
jgi:hypothetical protein